MKKSEILREHYDEILDALKAAYTDVIQSRGRIQVKVYIWEDGEIETLTDAQGSSTRLAPRDAEPRQLYHVATVEKPFFDPWDYSNDPKPEDADEAEKAEEEIISWYIDEYTDEEMMSVLDNAIDDAEMEESIERE